MSIIDEMLIPFKSISLIETEAVKLQNRIDTKYVFHISKLPVFLEQLQEDYRVLEIEGVRLQRYQTVYFDTPYYWMYLNHHNGHLKRFKLRSRRYLDTGQTFFEIKCKTNKERTIKNRTRQEGQQEEISVKQAHLLSLFTSFSAEMLVPSLWVSFSRITLVNQAQTERITIDTGLQYRKDGKEVTYSNLIIAELKQDRTAVSRFQRIAHNNHINGMKISKYCLGIISLNRQIKQNRFKEKLIQINKISHDAF